jgi:putative ABC transport system substrate-binding protein
MKVSREQWAGRRAKLERGKKFICFALSTMLFALCVAVEAQQAAKPVRIGFMGNRPTAEQLRTDVFRQRLRELGWVEGQNILIEYRWANGRLDRAPQLADELVKLKVDVIFAPASLHVEAAKQATTTIPIVFAVHGDPIGAGHAASLARPGGNITGLAQMQTELNAKGLELLKECVPRVIRVAILWNPATPSHRPILKAVEETGRALGLRLQPVPVESTMDFDTAFAAIVRERAEAVLVQQAPIFGAERQQLIKLALKHRLPTMFGTSNYVENGGLMSYGPDLTDLYRRAAVYVDKILKGAKPADLPVEQAMKFELFINLKTAKQIGLTIPPNLLVRADKVIQ